MDGTIYWRLWGTIHPSPWRTDTFRRWEQLLASMRITVLLQVYWDNGFLHYWEAKQLPNFVLAAPAVVMVLHHSYHFLSIHWDYVKRLGLVDNNLLGLPRRPCLQVRQYQVLPRWVP